MSTVVESDLRHEIDENIAVSSTIMQKNSSACRYEYANLKTKLRIRTLPRECNPTPSLLGSVSSPPDMLSPISPISVFSKHDKQETRIESMQVDNPFDDITEEKLKQLAQMPDLKRVLSLEIKIDSTKQSVEVIGELLPSLQQLRFMQSSLSSFRDLGTSLRSLRVLWAMDCQISDLDGIGALVNLEELYLQHNNVSDISPLTMHDEVRVIDFEGNKITDIGQIEQLAFCPQLKSLRLAGNTIETVKQYRQIVANFLPQLVTFDDKDISESEKLRLSDLEIDAIMQSQTDKLVNEGIKSVELRLPNEILSPRQLSCSSSSTSLNGLSLGSPRGDDSGSRLTHGTDIVFAGNVSSALRRHRHEAKTGSPHGMNQTARSSFEGAMSSANSHLFPSPRTYDRLKTQAGRISITDTLDRAKELDSQKHKSRDALVEELKTWQLDSAGISQAGGVCAYDEALQFENVASIRSRSRRKGSVEEIAGNDIESKARVERRLNTSVGGLRHGANVREAFVDLVRSTSHCSRPNLRNETLKQQPTSRLDVHILDVKDDSKRQCSSLETPRKANTTTSSCTKALGYHHDWNLDVLAPTVNLSSAKRHLPTSLNKQQLERSLASGEDAAFSDSDTDDESRRCPANVTAKSMSTPKRVFFNVVQSLDAIEKWRDEMDLHVDEDGGISRAGFRRSSLSPRKIVESSQKSRSASNQQISPLRREDLELPLGPGNHETDHHLVRLVRERHGQFKTRDGFRSYFRGIEKERLETILLQALGDIDKVRRRMQLMVGFFRHELQC